MDPTGNEERWQLVGSTAEAYERHLVPRLFAPWAQRLVDLVAPGPAERVLDVAGTAAADASPPIQWRTGDAGALPFPDDDFDVVLCQQGVQFFPDPAEALREMCRVLVPQGRLAVSVWRDVRHNAGFQAMTAALERHAGAAAAAIMRRPFAGDASRLRERVAAAGFTQVRIRIEIGSVRFPSPEDFLRQQAAASPLAEPLRIRVVVPLEAAIITARTRNRS